VGPLYLIFGAALLSGSALRGAEFTFVFGLGTLPLLWLGQTQWLRWQGRLNPIWAGRLQRGVALCGAIFMAVRLVSGPSLSQIEERGGVNCPLCPIEAVEKP
jgi:sulfite exporter TauE/SafE